MKYNKEEIIDICNSIDTTTVIDFGKTPPPFNLFFGLDGMVDTHSFHDVYYHTDNYTNKYYNIYVYFNLTNFRKISCHFDYMNKFFIKNNKAPIIEFNSLKRLNKMKKLCNL